MVFTSVSMPVPMLSGTGEFGGERRDVGADHVAHEHVIARLLAVTVDHRLLAAQEFLR